MIVHEANFNQVYYKLLDRLEKKGIMSTTRKGAEITELFDEKFVFTNALQCLALCRDMSFEYLEKEMAFYMSGSDKLGDAIQCSPFWKNCSDDDETINSNYGKLLFHDKNEKGFTQFEHALNCLKNNPQSKKAVMVIYDKENAFISNDNPCTMFLKIRIDKDNKLHMAAYMRSSDVYYGLPYDVPFFAFVQYCMAEQLKCKVGSYTHIAGSLHKYRSKEKELVKAFNKGKREGKKPNDRTYEAFRFIEKLFLKTYQNFFNLAVPVRVTKNSFMQLAWNSSEQSSCLKKKVGGCLTIKKELNPETVIATGFGGVSGPACLTCAREIEDDKYYGDECPSVHSEMRCIIKAYTKGFTDFSKMTIYVTHGPCDACLKLCDFVGIKRVIYDKPYKTNYSHWPNIEVIQVDELETSPQRT